MPPLRRKTHPLRESVGAGVQALELVEEFSMLGQTR